MKGFQKMQDASIDLMASLEEIEKMDIILKIKANEEKKAKLSRIQTEEETRDVLSKLPFPKRPKDIKVNVEKFFSLLDGDGKTKEDGPSYPELSGVTGMEESEEKKKAEIKREKINNQQLSKSNPPFVERNILLAKCGRGTLFLTDGEKCRIENLLEDIGGLAAKAATETSRECEAFKTGAEIKEEFYAVDCTTKSILNQIDQQLEGLKKLKTQSELVLLGKGGGNVFKECVGGDSGGERKKKKKKINRLEEIDKLLISMTTTSDEEITPLSEEQMENLLRASRESLRREEIGRKGKGDGCPGEGDEWSSRQLPQKVITELVSDAKLLMPKFKYRFKDA